LLPLTFTSLTLGLNTLFELDNAILYHYFLKRIRATYHTDENKKTVRWEYVLVFYFFKAIKRIQRYVQFEFYVCESNYIFNCRDN